MPQRSPRSHRTSIDLKYHNSIADAVSDLGRPENIGKMFSGFQKYLYQQQAAA